MLWELDVILSVPLDFIDIFMLKIKNQVLLRDSRRWDKHTRMPSLLPVLYGPESFPLMFWLGKISA